MRRTRILLLVAVVAACSGIPARDYAAYSNMASTAVENLTALRAAGKIDDASYAEITPVIHALDAARKQWRAAIENADPATGRIDVPKSVVNAVLDGIDQLVIWRAKLAKEGS